MIRAKACRYHFFYSYIVSFHTAFNKSVNVTQHLQFINLVGSQLFPSRILQNCHGIFAFWRLRNSIQYRSLEFVPALQELFSYFIHFVFLFRAYWRTHHSWRVLPSSMSFILPLSNRNERTSLRISLGAVGLPLEKYVERKRTKHFLCKYRLLREFPTFPTTTALQRKLNIWENVRLLATCPFPNYSPKIQPPHPHWHPLKTSGIILHSPPCCQICHFN